MENQENVEPEAKRRKSLSLKKKKVPLEERFTVVSSKVVDKGRKVLYQRTP